MGNEPIYTTSLKDRLEMLKQSLPTWQKQPHKAILILDWDSPDQEQVAEFVKSVQDGTVYLATVKNREFYEHSRCRNLKTALASLCVEDIKQRFIFSIDVDIKVHNDPMVEIEEKWQSKDALYLFGGIENGWMPHSAGTSIHTMDKFLAAGGCDEDLQGWGREDLKFFENMSAVAMKLQLSKGIIEHIPHDDRMRTKYCKEKNKWVSNAQNGLLMEKKPVVHKRDFDIEFISPDGNVSTIGPDQGLYGEEIEEIAKNQL